MNETERKNKDILILSDQQEECDDLINLLTPRFGVPLSSLNPHQAALLLKTDKPAVLILAFQRVDFARKAERILQSALDGLKLYRPQRVLMCKASESEQAYDLYAEGLIDDFIADRPLYDPHRLRLSVSQALERRSYRLVSDDLLKVIERIDADMHGLDHFVEGLMESVDKEHHESIEMFHYLTRKVVNELEVLHDGLSRRQHAEPADNAGLAHDTTHQDTLRETADWLVELRRDFRKSHVSAGAEVVARPPDESRVLLVDDDDFYRDVFVSMMQGSGYIVETADHGGTAIDLARKNPPDVILLDYKMPGIDGLEVLEILRSEQATRTIPVIMLTGVSSKFMVDRSMKGGAQDFIVKPGSRDVILRKIATAMARRR